MACPTVFTQLAPMYVLMATSTSLLCEDSNVSSVIVAAKALCGFVCDHEGQSRFHFMVELEIFTDFVPGSLHMAERTVGWKLVVRNRWTSFVIPFLRPKQPFRG